MCRLTRYDVVGLLDGPEEYRAHVIVWIFLLGWATAKAAHIWHRLVVSALVLATVPGFFDGLERTVVVISGVLLLVWLPAVRVPAILAGPTTTLAGASLVIYLTHWQVYPWIEDAGYHLLATVASLAVGVAVWWAINQALGLRDQLGWRRLGREPRVAGRSGGWGCHLPTIGRPLSTRDVHSATACLNARATKRSGRVAFAPVDSPAALGQIDPKTPRHSDGSHPDGPWE